jgi:hypothetical protein
MNFRQPALAQQLFPDPRIDARLAQHGTRADGAAPARQLRRRHGHNGPFDACRHCGAQWTFGLDEGDENSGTARVHFVRGIGPYQGSAAAQPVLSRAATDAQCAAHRHEEVHAVMTMEGRGVARSPDDHRGGPGERPGHETDQHGVPPRFQARSRPLLHAKRPMAPPASGERQSPTERGGRTSGETAT